MASRHTQGYPSPAISEVHNRTYQLPLSRTHKDDKGQQCGRVWENEPFYKILSKNVNWHSFWKAN